MVNNYSIGESAERNWGNWYVLDKTDECVIKKIMVNVGGKLSLQTHNHRSENWFIVQGLAEITLGKQKLQKKGGDFVIIPVHEFHRIANIGNKVLIFIEVQTGDYLDESDIVRYNEDYLPVLKEKGKDK